MKYVVIIADGASDVGIEALDGKTPLEAASTPHLDALARRGRVGTARTTPGAFDAGSDVCCMSLLGYDPERYHTGRAPLEASAMGLGMAEQDWVMRLNLVTTSEGRMLDHSAGGIDDASASTLIDALWHHWEASAPELLGGVRLEHGVSYRSILLDGSGREYGSVATVPPHEIPGEPWTEALPTGDGSAASEASASALRRLMELSGEVLPSHSVNAARAAGGEPAATMAWVWGQGRRPELPSFESRFGVQGAMITGVDLLAGLARLIGWERLDVPGAGSFHEETDYAAQGAAACAAIGSHDLVCCHVESPDEASHQGDWETKVGAIEAIDVHVIGPVMSALSAYGDPESDPSAEGWRVMVLPDHYTLVSTRRHDATPVPFAMGGAWVRSVVPRVLSESEAASSDLHIEDGHELMEYFLRGGLARVTGGR